MKTIKTFEEFVNEGVDIKPELFILNHKGKLLPGIITKVPQGYDIESGPFKDMEELIRFAKNRGKKLSSEDIVDLSK